MVVVEGDELVIVHTAHHHQDQDHEEDEEEEVHVGYHLVPIGHLVLKWEMEEIYSFGFNRISGIQ